MGTGNLVKEAKMKATIPTMMDANPLPKKNFLNISLVFLVAKTALSAVSFEYSIYDAFNAADHIFFIRQHVDGHNQRQKKIN